MKALENEEIFSKLADLPSWSYKDKKLYCEFSFNDFVEAFSFMTQVALESEKLTITQNGKTFTIGWKSIWLPMMLDQQLVSLIFL